MSLHNHTDAIDNVESFTAQKPTLFVSLKVLKLFNLFKDLTAPILSVFESIWGLKLNLFESFRALQFIYYLRIFKSNPIGLTVKGSSWYTFCVSSSWSPESIFQWTDTEFQT